MYFVYIIQSVKTKQLYFGKTSNLKRRIAEHNNNEQTATAFKGPWRLVYYEAYSSSKDASLREKVLKQYGNARTYVKKRIKNSLL